MAQANVEIVRNAFQTFAAEGIDAQRRGFVISRFRDGTFREVRTFPSWSEALDAVGLAE
jgi:hypothetical protein